MQNERGRNRRIGKNKHESIQKRRKYNEDRDEFEELDRGQTKPRHMKIAE